MLIERLKFIDFLVFRGEQELRFPFGRDSHNLTLILASNNSGKTSIIRAIEFLLYGEGDRVRQSKLASLSAVAGLEPRGGSSCSVQATIRDGTRRFTVTRRLLYSRANENSLAVHPHDVQLEVIAHREERDERLQPSPVIEQLVANFVPRVMFDFFFFKGEELAQKLLVPHKGLVIPEELRKLLYKLEWELVVGTFEKVGKQLGRELARIASTEDEYRSKLAILDQLKETLNRQRGELEREEQRRAGLQQTRRQLEDEIQRLASAANPTARDRLQRVGTELQKIDQRRRTLVDRRRDLLSRHSANALAARQLSPVREALADLKKRRTLPPEVSEALLIRLLQEARCICGRELQDGTPELATVARLRETCLSEKVSGELWTLSSLTEDTHSGGFAASRSALIQGFEDIRREEEEVLDAELEVKREKEELEKSVNENLEAELRDKRIKRAQVDEQLTRLGSRIDELGNVVSSNERRLGVLRTEIRRLEGRGLQSRKLRIQAEICEQLWETARRCERSMTLTIQKELTATVQELYDGIVTDGSRARVDSKTLLPAIERSGISVPTGGGQEQTLLLCYITALAKLRKTMNAELRRRFGIPSFREQAFFMDSVFGQMQGEYRRGVAAVLPQNIQQLVLLLAGQQWDQSVAGGLEGRISHIYGLTLHSPKKVKDSDYRFRLGRQDVRLFEQLRPEDEAFTVITELE